MEFQYCDNCGDITQGSHGSGSDMLCASCAGSESAPGPASGLQLLDDPSGLGDDLSGNGAAKEKLDLFTSDPIAPSQARSAAPSHSSLKLVTDSSAVSNAAKGTSNGPSDAHPAVEFQDNLPPDQSPAERKPGSAAFGIGSPPLIEEDAMDMTQKMLGSLNQEPERWRVDCLHCAGSLSVKPAMKKSRLKCPRCQGVMVLDPSGTVRSVGATVGNASPSSTSRSAVTTTAPSASSSPNRAKEVPASPGESVAVLRESPVVAEESWKQ